MVLAGPELERQVADRISFIKFLGFPKTIPANVHDSKIDLANQVNDLYIDRKYFEHHTRVITPLGIEISVDYKITPFERQFAVIKNIFPSALTVTKNLPNPHKKHHSSNATNILIKKNN